MDINFPLYQKKVDAYIQGYEEGYWAPLAMFAAMVEEVGEIARLIGALENYKPLKAEKSAEDKNNLLKEEFGDLFFAMICLANNYEIDLDDALLESVNKFKTRDKDRYGIKHFLSSQY